MNLSMKLSQKQILRKILFLHIPVLFSLFILTDNDTYYNNDEHVGKEMKRRRHLAVFTALQRHPPSARVFRCLMEFVLLGFCASLSIYIWESIVGKDLLGRLLFDTPYTVLNEEDELSEFDMVSSLLESRETGIVDETPGGDAIISSGSSEDPDDDHNLNHHDDNIRSPFKQRVPAQPPSAASICNASLDMLLIILISIFFFTLSSSAGGRYIDQTNPQYYSFLAKVGDIAAPIFPLALFTFCIIKLFFPWNETKMQLWIVMSYTIGAPMYKVTFRDGFIGDILTSMVRPLQDLAFTSFYLMSGLKGWWTYREQTKEEDILDPVERSWLLHTVILPACMISPLWYRFCQTLRQTYVHKKRWPYLGNSAKYFFTAQVAVLGVFDPGMKKSVFWLAAFACATLYQIWWDVFMDWELLIWEENESFFKLRTKRLFQSKAWYLVITTINCLLRFCWTLNFIPNRYLSESGLLLETFSQEHFSAFLGPFLATAEIVRRTLWGFLRLELEAIHVQKEESKDKNTELLEKIPLEPMSVVDYGDHGGGQISSLSYIMDATPTIMEMFFYATTFTCFGIVAVVYRKVF